MAEHPDATQYGIDDAVASDPVACRRALLDWMAANVRADADGTTFEVWRYDRRSFATYSLGPCRIQLSGAHNVRNALAALAATSALGIAPELTIAALAEYRGTRRRFELKGEAGGITVIDDYAHHPTEVRVNLAAARDRYPGRRIVVYLQPHTLLAHARAARRLGRRLRRRRTSYGSARSTPRASTIRSASTARHWHAGSTIRTAKQSVAWHMPLEQLSSLLDQAICC